MSENNVISRLQALGIPSVAPETLSRVCEQVHWFESSVQRASMLLEEGGRTPEVDALVASLRTLLRASSDATAALLARLKVSASVQAIYDCAQQRPEFFRCLVAFSKGNEVAGQDAVAMLAPYATPSAAQAPNVQTEDAMQAAAQATVDHPPGDAVECAAEPLPARESPVSTAQTQSAAHAAIDCAVPAAPCSQPEPIACAAAKGALTFAIESSAQGGPMLRLEASPAVRPHGYDMRNPIKVTLSVNETILVFAVLLGLAPSVESSSRGSGGLRLKIDDQQSHFVVRVSQGQRLVVVPVSPMHALQLALRISDVLVSAHPQLQDMVGVRAFVAPFVNRLRLACAA